jgi:outer membrane protein OmpA-like peptidoglycan-associated protein
MTEIVGGLAETERVHSLISRANAVDERSLPGTQTDDHTLPWALLFIGVAGLVVGGLAGFVLGKQRAEDEARATRAIPVASPAPAVVTLAPSQLELSDLPDSTQPLAPAAAPTSTVAPTTSAAPTTTVAPGPTTTEPPPPFPSYLAADLSTRANFGIFDGQSIIISGQMSTKEMADDWESHVDTAFDIPVVNDITPEAGRGSASGYLSFPGLCYFEVGSTSPRPDCEALLGSIARAVLADPDAKILVSGHSDSNDSVSRITRSAEQRANAARDVLIREGVPAERITVLPRGDSDPAGDNATADGRARNRRVDVIVDNMLP